LRKPPDCQVCVPQATAALFMERLVLTWVGKPFAFELMPGLNRLGRNPTNDCRVADASLSSFHCEITLAADNSVRVRDLASTNGTYIDGEQIVDAQLRPGQVLRLGTVELALERVMVAEPVLAGGETEAETWLTEDDDGKKSLFRKLTQTLKIPFRK
jgi:pSer/pThr/pTyr-binding forkhead associated (FHA) protein